MTRFDCDKCGDSMPQVHLVCQSCGNSEELDQDSLEKEEDGTFVYELRGQKQELISRTKVICSDCEGRLFELRSQTLCPACEHMQEKESQA